jgi:hypothetical protein
MSARRAGRLAALKVRSKEVKAMALTREKLLAAIHGDIAPGFAEVIEQCLAAGWIVQDGERPDGNGVMRPAYRITDAGRAVLWR